MIGLATWQFTQAESYAQKLGLKELTGIHGYAENHGRTEDALRVILNKFKEEKQDKFERVSRIIVTEFYDLTDRTWFVFSFFNLNEQFNACRRLA